MSNPREEILHRIRQGLRGSSDTTPILEQRSFKGKAKEVLGLIRKSEHELRTQFRGELAKVNTNILDAKSDSEIITNLRKLIEDKELKSFSIWETEFIKELDLKGGLKNAGLKLITAKNKNRIAKSDIGITEVDYAIADTGTLVLMANKNQPRSTSLLPPIHLAIVRPKNLVRNINDLFVILKSKLEEGEDLTNCMTFITGPSRTADIELNLTLGVHGPKELYVLLISDNDN